MNNNSFFVTTPIYYVNDSPHIGHAYTSIACDVIARFNRLNNKKTMFLTGTDEHGLKIEQASKKKNMNTKEFVDKMSLDFKKLTKLLNLSNDFFVRTTENFHKKASQHIWKILKKNNQIYLDKYKGWYSISDESYFNDIKCSRLQCFLRCISSIPILKLHYVIFMGALRRVTTKDCNE